MGQSRLPAVIITLVLALAPSAAASQIQFGDGARLQWNSANVKSHWLVLSGFQGPAVVSIGIHELDTWYRFERQVFYASDSIQSEVG